MIKVAVWNEFFKERDNTSPASALYPDGVHAAIRDGIAAPDLDIRLAALDDPDQGLPDSLLNELDTLVWWGHVKHNAVSDALVEKIKKRVWDGMGLVVLHSGHYSKIFQALNGTSCRLRWRESGDRERIWCADPSHPVAAGIPESFTLEHEEMYGEPFMIAPDAHPVFYGWFRGGETFRAGVALQRENGRIFYFQPGHETHDSFRNPHVLRVIANAVRWTGSSVHGSYPDMHRPEPLER